MNRRTWLIAGSSALLLAVLAYGLIGRERSVAALRRVAAEQSIVPVQVISPQKGPAVRSLVLPGNVNAWYQAPIYAQVSGYVQKWNEDYGADVKAGQVLATIDAPGLDAQYAAAQATLRVAQANYRLAVSTAKRWEALAGTPAVAQQEVDAQTAAAAARKAEMEAAAQNVARYAALEGFKRVTAPFDGVVTARITNVGDYVNAGGSDLLAGGKATQLFTVADVHALRVFVSVPQDYARLLGPGVTAKLREPSQPGKSIEAKFLTTARAFDPNTRTAVTELTVDNSNHSLWPGTYVDVVFQIPTDPSVLTIPEAALIFRQDGAQVATVDSQNHLHLRNVTLGQNLGKSVQVTSGLSADDKVVNNPSAGLLEGQAVQPVTPATGYAVTTQSESDSEERPDQQPPPLDAAKRQAKATTP